MLNLAKEKLTEMFRKMLEIRFFEEKVFDLYAQNLVPGTIHLYTGEEAVAVGVCAALEKTDYVTSTHRGHGHCIAKGADLKRTMAEILGKRTGYCKGKGGSMHIADFSIGMLGATAVVGAGMPIAVGAGLSIKLRKTRQVVACFFGEGASNQGTFHEGINMASIWRLPVIFICENNLYAMGTHQSRVMNIENIADRALAYGIPGVIADGNDVLAVYEKALQAVERARKGEGPTLIECKTYRHKGHSRVDPAKYRPKAEVEEWLAKDPIKRFKEKLLQEGVLIQVEVQKIEREVAAEIEEAVKYAMESPYPAPEEALEDVYA
ncbi:MAG: thiamine pyrophosphate-dependent dehydrogenase E1 component subunit alpha [Candidatus Bathyarchaeota archaeon]|nr:thiamine pyrophosphate-dependent dehydrogenase E1 component subunit alpha [Candidatus Bathyarchaeota archaeon]MDI6805409.1 thiamine pyrophosphate-dependent dehydrogenase E1 component subunit alpha [Candidatus Bathyarchaeia archaeon]